MLCKLVPTPFLLQVSHTSRLDQRKKDREHAKVMKAELETAKHEKEKNEKMKLEEEQSQRMREQSKIVTPGVKTLSTPYSTPLHKRRFGL